MKAVAYCDGRGGHGTGACACVITLADGTVIEEAKRLEEPTNNIAEYEGVLLAIEFALQYGVTDLEIRSDSRVIVHQVDGKYQCREKHLEKLRDKVWNEGSKFERIEIKWVPREENHQADRLANRVDREPSPRKNPFKH